MDSHRDVISRRFPRFFLARPPASQPVTERQRSYELKYSHRLPGRHDRNLLQVHARGAGFCESDCIRDILSIKPLHFFLGTRKPSLRSLEIDVTIALQTACPPLLSADRSAACSMSLHPEVFLENR
jgi:hypothetical protein